MARLTQWRRIRRYGLPTYTPTARALHWLIAFLVFIQLPLGLYMSYRGNEMEHGQRKRRDGKGRIRCSDGRSL